MVRTNDLVSLSSGVSHIGINGGPNGAFDITSMAPYGHIIQLSGIFLDPLLGQSGVLRYSREQAAFQSSVDGGLTFANLATAGNTVTSLAIEGGTQITGDVELASSSGFIVLGDTAGASPITIDVDVWGISGLFMLPPNGFSNVPQCYAETFTAQTPWTVTHSLNTEDVQVFVLDDSSPRQYLIPDSIVVTNSNTVTVNFNLAQAGRVVIIGC